jgi:hypothetical protein
MSQFLKADPRRTILPTELMIEFESASERGKTRTIDRHEPGVGARLLPVEQPSQRRSRLHDARSGIRGKIGSVCNQRDTGSVNS